MKLRRVKFKDIEKIPQMKVHKSFKSDFFGSSPAPFIGRHGYPKVNIGVLSPQFGGDTSYYHSPKLWSKANFKIGQVASMRYRLVNSRSQAYVKTYNQKNKYLEIAQEVGTAKRAVELEVNLNKTPSLNTQQEQEIMPFGPNASIKRAKITENPKVDTRVDRIISDTDLKSVKGILELYKKGFEEAQLSKILSVGQLGIEKNRKLVPTRWSITATDSTISNQLIKDIKEFQPCDYQLYFGGEWGNYYLILNFSDVWSYELFETYLDSKVNPWSKSGLMYSTDYEPYKGRSKYAEETAGGYYTVRLAVSEKLKSLKRQGTTLALRFITEEYNVPLGVWVTREACRKALNSKPINFASKELMIEYATKFIQKKFSFDINLLLKESKIIKQAKEQAKLTQFFS